MILYHSEEGLSTEKCFFRIEPDFFPCLCRRADGQHAFPSCCPEVCPIRPQLYPFRSSAQSLRPCRPRLQTPVFGRLKYSRVCLRGWLLTCRLNFALTGLSLISSPIRSLKKKTFFFSYLFTVPGMVDHPPGDNIVFHKTFVSIPTIQI